VRDLVRLPIRSTQAGNRIGIHAHSYTDGDASGDELWTRSPAGTGGVIAATGSAVFLAGARGGSAFVARWDADGNEVWGLLFGVDGSSLWVQDIAADASGVYVTGHTFGALTGQTHAGDIDIFVRKYDLDGNVVWTDQFGTGGLDEGSGITVNASGVYVTGRSEVLPRQTIKGHFLRPRSSRSSKQSVTCSTS